MPRPSITPQALTIGQVAARWSVSPERVRSLVENGKLPGAFRIPSAGRYGATVKIPMAAVLEAEREWVLAPTRGLPAPDRKNDSRVVLKHFPHLNGEFQPDAESPAAAGR